LQRGGGYPGALSERRKAGRTDGAKNIIILSRHPPGPRLCDKGNGGEREGIPKEKKTESVEIGGAERGKVGVAIGSFYITGTNTAEEGSNDRGRKTVLYGGNPKPVPPFPKSLT